jgi:hypothetical protein
MYNHDQIHKRLTLISLTKISNASFRQGFTPGYPARSPSGKCKSVPNGFVPESMTARMQEVEQRMEQLPGSQGRQGSDHIPVSWIPAVHAGMTRYLSKVIGDKFINDRYQRYAAQY